MKYYGKEKCRILKEIRAEIARENDIEWVVSECKHQGNCRGTCPKCEQEVRQLEEALAKREALGKKVAVVGISASIALSVTGCINPFPETTAGVAPEPGGDTQPEAETLCDTATAGEPLEYSTEAGEIVLDGEMPEMVTDVEKETDEEMEPGVLMGAIVIPSEDTEESETDDDTDLETAEVLMGDMPV